MEKENPYRTKQRPNNSYATIYERGRKAGIKEVVDFIDYLIIGIDGCKFEERLDGDKGCIVLDMNENQWRAKLKEWGIRVVKDSRESSKI